MKNKKLDSLGLPLGQLNAVRMEDGTLYKILPQDKLSDRVMETPSGTVILPTEYAIFKKSDGFCQQVSKWYINYGNCLRMLARITGQLEAWKLN